MKKTISILSVMFAGMFAAGLFAQEEKLSAAEQMQMEKQATNNIAAEIQDEKPSCSKVLAGKILFYLPNRIMDAMDTFDLTIRGGAVTDANVRLTRAFGLGAGIGPNLAAIKETNRQYGVALEGGYNAQFLFLQTEDTNRLDPIGSVKEYWQFGSNFPLPSDKIYDWKTGARDYWAIEVSASLFAGAKTAIHPIEIADFVLGFFLIDIKDDDIRFNAVVY